MHDGQRGLTFQHNVAPDDLVRRLGARYRFVLLAVVMLIAADQAIIQPLLVRLNVYAPAINTAGRQRMLSQKLAKAALAMEATDDPGERTRRLLELRQSLDEWSSAHDALRHGDLDGGVTRIHSPAIDAAWAELQADFSAMQAAARQLVSDPSLAGDDRSSAVAALVRHEAPFLAAMERIVKLMEQEAAAELRRLRACAMAIAGAIVALVIGLGWYVIRPATRAIRSQVNDLESQVARGTCQLDAALVSLQATESRNQSLAAQLAHADRVESIGHLAAGLAHELNQPLGAITNYAEACRVVLAAPPDERSHGKLQDYAQGIQQASMRAGSIVRRIRNFVRPGTSQKARVDLITLVQEVVELCRPEAARAEIELALDHSGHSEIIVAVDPIQIQQVLVNLMQNAIQAMESAPPQRRRLAVALAVAHGAVQVDVIDGGPGLAQDDPETLFAPFRTTKPDGLGIGLSICRSIIEDHQGTIWARSLPSHGAQFSFVLPLAERHAIQSDRHPDGVCR